ncbi:MAG: EF-hand domain-containing protein [Alphaproteobacteria bacterium]|nr:EF-hand domain-containing protein [Alphaproteobacteria bacterium]
MSRFFFFFFLFGLLTAGVPAQACIGSNAQADAAAILRKTFDGIDVQRHGRITLDEWLASEEGRKLAHMLFDGLQSNRLLGTKEQSADQKIRDLFAKLDKDNDGGLAFDEWSVAFPSELFVTDCL